MGNVAAQIGVMAAQAAALIALSPLVTGLIAVIKNTIRMRRGQPLAQPYYTLAKLFRKDEVVSVHASWIFSLTPFIVLAASVAACLLVPVCASSGLAARAGDLFALIFVLALGRFFLSLAGLDTSSSFGGMGSSREMFLSSLAEPGALLALFTAGLVSGSSDVSVMAQAAPVRVSLLVAAGALYTVILAETSRVPVDNRETHLELTMIHEAMVLEYSGRPLALLELAAHIKQIVFFSILALMVFPSTMPLSAGAAGLGWGIAVYLCKLFFLCVVTAAVEISVAKMRLFRAVDFLAISLLLSVLSLVTFAMGL